MKIINLTNSNITLRTDNDVIQVKLGTISDDIDLTNEVKNTLIQFFSIFGNDLKVVLTDAEKIKWARKVNELPATMIVSPDDFNETKDDKADGIFKDAEGNLFKMEVPVANVEVTTTPNNKDIDYLKNQLKQALAKINALEKVNSELRKQISNLPNTQELLKGYVTVDKFAALQGVLEEMNAKLNTKLNA